MYMRVCLVFLTVLPYLVFDNLAFLLSCAISFWGIYSFLSVIIIDNFTALLTFILCPSLLGIFCLLMTLCIMNVTVACMGISIHH